MKLKWYLIILTYAILALLNIIFISSYKNEFFNNRPFPFDTGKTSDNETETNETQIIICIPNTISDGNCDEQNNRAECQWDGGDCCAKSCLTTCEAKNKTDTPCKFKCGANPYNCLNPNSNECESCGSNGRCIAMEACMRPKAAFNPILLSVRFLN